MAEQQRPAWAWWGMPPAVGDLQFAPRLCERAAEFEQLIFADKPSSPLDRALQRYQREQKKMGRNDRLLLGTAVYALARNRELLRDAFDEPRPGARLLLALLDAVGQADAFTFLPASLGLPAALARVQAQRAAAVATLQAAEPQPVAALDAATQAAFTALCGVPYWWLADGPWLTLGDALAELARLKQPQSLILRVNAHRTDRATVLAELATLGIPATATQRSPWGIVISGRHNVLGTKLWRDGLIEVQDEGSQLVACLCDPKPDEKVLDLCAGGGGKSLALAAARRNRGTLVATDTDVRRLADVRTRASRAQLDNIIVARTEEEVRTRGPYQLVLADAPCSSSGTLRRNPDVAWRWTHDDVARLTQLQAEVLDRAATLVAPGGQLVYVTCSIFPAENAHQAAAFAARHPDFVPAPPGDRSAHAALAGLPGAESGAFRLAANTPEYSGDAFFLARWRRT